MKTKFLTDEFTYDGRQLRPLYAYLEHGLAGDSALAWIGPCDVSFAHMIDAEDVVARASISGGRMLHFLVEVFDRDLFSGVALQRLMASMARDICVESSKLAMGLTRSGDDLFLGDRKLSISIASRSPVSTMIHFAMNVRNEGTPVPTCALEDDFGLKAKIFAEQLLNRLSREYQSMVVATRKVRPLA